MLQYFAAKIKRKIIIKISCYWTFQENQKIKIGLDSLVHSYQNNNTGPQLRKIHSRPLEYNSRLAADNIRPLEYNSRPVADNIRPLEYKSRPVVDNIRPVEEENDLRCTCPRGSSPSATNSSKVSSTKDDIWIEDDRNAFVCTFYKMVHFWICVIC